MTTFKELREALDRLQRKKAARRMAMLAKKPSTQHKREKGKLLQWSKQKINTKAKKAVRKFYMQKAAGKGKDITNLSDSEKERLEVKTDKLMKGKKATGLIRKKEKEIKQKHKEDIKKAKEKKDEKSK